MSQGSVEPFNKAVEAAVKATLPAGHPTARGAVVAAYPVVVAEIVAALRDWDEGWRVHPADFIEGEFG